LFSIMNFKFEKSLLKFSIEQRKALHIKYFELFTTRKIFNENKIKKKTTFNTEHFAYKPKINRVSSRMAER